MSIRSLLYLLTAFMVLSLCFSLHLAAERNRSLESYLDITNTQLAAYSAKVIKLTRELDCERSPSISKHAPDYC